MSVVAPSLECVPGKYNAGILFSQLPMDGSGDFTVTRTTTPTAGQSTRVNAAGLIETVPDNVPRLDYPIGGGCPALLVEPSAVNLCLQSAAFATSPWILTTATSPNTTATTDPFGQTNANLFTATANFGRTQQQVTRTASGTHTISCFVKGVAGVASIGSLICGRGVGFTITSGGVVTVNAPVGYTQAATIGVENYGNGWYRIFAVLTHLTTPTPGGDGFLIGSSVSGNSFYIFGAQMEAGSIATSYIPTTTGPVTRSADVISKTGATALIGQTEGTVYLEVNAPNASQQVFAIGTGGTNSIHIYKIASSQYRASINGQSGGGSVDLTDSIARTGFVKLAIAYKSGESALVANGSTPVTSATSLTFGALTSVNFFGTYQAALPFRVRALALYPTRLSNIDLVNMTAPDGSFLWGVNAPIRLWGTATNEIWG